METTASSQPSKGTTNTSTGRSAILGGVIGGAFALAVIIIIAYKVTITIKRRNNQRHMDAELKQDIPGNKNKERPLEPIRAQRPFPGDPRNAPALPATQPYTRPNLHHEATFITRHGVIPNHEQLNPFL